MNKSIINKNILIVMSGFLFIGGGAALLGIYRAAKNFERPPGCVMQDHDGEMFVYGAHA